MGERAQVYFIKQALHGSRKTMTAKSLQVVIKSQGFVTLLTYTPPVTHILTVKLASKKE